MAGFETDSPEPSSASFRSTETARHILRELTPSPLEYHQTIRSPKAALHHGQPGCSQAVLRISSRVVRSCGAVDRDRLNNTPLAIGMSLIGKAHSEKQSGSPGGRPVGSGLPRRFDSCFD